VADLLGVVHGDALCNEAHSVSSLEKFRGTFTVDSTRRMQMFLLSPCVALGIDSCERIPHSTWRPLMRNVDA
jgi:hypothetical protein